MGSSLYKEEVKENTNGERRLVRKGSGVSLLSIEQTEVEDEESLLFTSTPYNGLKELDLCIRVLSALSLNNDINVDQTKLKQEDLPVLTAVVHPPRDSKRILRVSSGFVLQSDSISDSVVDLVECESRIIQVSHYVNGVKAAWDSAFHLRNRMPHVRLDRGLSTATSIGTAHSSTTDTFEWRNLLSCNSTELAYMFEPHVVNRSETESNTPQSPQNYQQMPLWLRQQPIGAQIAVLYALRPEIPGQYLMQNVASDKDYGHPLVHALNHSLNIKPILIFCSDGKFFFFFSIQIKN